MYEFGWYSEALHFIELKVSQGHTSFKLYKESHQWYVEVLV